MESKKETMYTHKLDKVNVPHHLAKLLMEQYMFAVIDGKCHCQKTRLCTTGSYRYDKIAVAKSTAVGKFHLSGWKFYRKLHFRHTNRIAALYPNIKNSRTFILWISLPSSFCAFILCCGCDGLSCSISISKEIFATALNYRAH